MPRAKLTMSRTRVPAFCALTALTLSVSACTGEPESEPAARTPRPSATASTSPTVAQTSSPPSSPPPTSASPSASVTATPTSQPSTTVEATEGPSPSPTPPPTVTPPPPGSSPREMLLRAGEIPGLNDQHRWKAVGTANRERPREPIWACQVTDFFSIGATDVWVRRFVGRPGGADTALARSAVITFVDDTSARRAYAVLRAWHDRCEEQLGGEYPRVSVDAAPTAVEVQGPGQAEWRMAIYGPAEGEREAGYFDATGYVREGSRISLITMVNVGQDYNYPRGEEPIVGAVRNSAVKLLG